MLQERSKWTQASNNLANGDIVLLVDDMIPRNQWLMGRVVQTFPGDDGHVRKAEVMSRGKTYERPIHKLVLLLNRGSPVEEPNND
jgi:hypothetical protein